MRLSPTPIDGVVVIEAVSHVDERGSFSRLYCRETFAAAGLLPHVEQTNLSVNHRAGTLRGLHLQRAPHAEAKLVRCIRGALFDVVVDLRAGSATYLQWVGIELDADAGRAVHVPEGCAHGFQTLADDTMAIYDVSAVYRPDHEEGLHPLDPRLGIDWPRPVTVMSDKDRSWPLLAGTHG